MLSSRLRTVGTVAAFYCGFFMLVHSPASAAPPSAAATTAPATAKAQRDAQTAVEAANKARNAAQDAEKKATDARIAAEKARVNAEQAAKTADDESKKAQQSAGIARDETRAMPSDNLVALLIWFSALGAIIFGFRTFIRSRSQSASRDTNRRPADPATQPAASDEAGAVTDKDLEMSRISYGFWLLIAGMFVTLGVVIVAVSYFENFHGQVSDVIAVVTAVTGVIGTAITAFFGIQAAGAGRSQALSALGNQIQAQANGNAGAGYKLDPAYGPHAGNTSVSITGNGLTGVTAVNFGATPGSNVQAVNDGLVRVTTPPVPIDRTGGKNAKSDTDVSVIYPNAPNRLVGTFYYYTIERHPDVAATEQVFIYGSGLTGATAVQFGDSPPVKIETAGTDSFIQVPAAGIPTTDKAWTEEVEVAVIFSPDSPTKRTVIGRVRLNPLRPAQPEQGAAGAGQGVPAGGSGSSASASSIAGSSSTSNSSMMSDASSASSLITDSTSSSNES